MQDCAGANNASGSMGTVVFLVMLGIVFDHKVELAFAHTQWHIGIHGCRCISYV